jgi:hypothetical protein
VLASLTMPKWGLGSPWYDNSPHCGRGAAAKFLRLSLGVSGAGPFAIDIEMFASQKILRIVQLELTVIAVTGHMQHIHWPDRTPDTSTRHYLRVFIVYCASVGQYTMHENGNCVRVP